MASTLLYTGEVSVTDIRLRDVIDDTPVYYTAIVSTPVFLYEGEVTKELPSGVQLQPPTLQLTSSTNTDILLYGVLEGVPSTLRAYQSTDIILSDATVARSGGPVVTYYGTLKVWNGSSWVAKTLKVYISSWVTKPVKRYSGTEWLLVKSN